MVGDVEGVRARAADGPGLLRRPAELDQLDHCPGARINNGVDSLAYSGRCAWKIRAS